MSDYRCVSVKCKSVEDAFTKQSEIGEIVVEEGGKMDGGGMMIGNPIIRDIFFDATSDQFKAILKRVKRKYKVV